ncbi:DUF4198 domain-containing protein [Hymenobacter rubripertinctus]|uniref:DUF4198 domain-containing protein n=1 Tax=Hymenobacter rubripertinctus TaxID=2029981 RepID=A0A418QZ82_9BACT|nr:DUF4198 domain-containing protein [Hymenobacter rubripertinctus]RIY10475.1 DUF4198 domain-containing protein [Hymenobacter rubripertinctus]
MKRVLPLLLLLLATTALAREFWLAPAQFWVVPGAAVYLRRLVGDNFAGTPWPGRSARLTAFRHYAPGQPPADLLTAAGPVADTIRSTVTLGQPGTHLVALQTDYALVTLPADQFTAYLHEQGFGYALAQRAQRGQTAAPGREAYRRCATTLVQAGAYAATDTARAWGRPAGLALELVPEQNPYGLRPGAALTVRVLAAGQPVAGLLVRLWQRGARGPVLLGKLHSNQNGRVLLHLPTAGSYLISCVEMASAPAASAAHWHSTWSTLTFGIADKERP